MASITDTRARAADIEPRPAAEATPLAGPDTRRPDRRWRVWHTVGVLPRRRLRAVLILNLGRPGPDAWSDRLPRLDHDDVIQTL